MLCMKKGVRTPPSDARAANIEFGGERGVEVVKAAAASPRTVLPTLVSRAGIIAIGDSACAMGADPFRAIETQLCDWL